MRAVVAVLLSVSLLACFPDNARHRTYAKVTEGSLMAIGIAMLAITNTGADCDQMGGLGNLPDKNCKSSASNLGGVGLGLIIIGMVGFLATVSTAPDDKPTPPAPTPTPTATPAKMPTTGTGSASLMQFER
jgi:hypothetical protein